MSLLDWILVLGPGLLGFGSTIILFVWALCRAAADADEDIEQLHRRRDCGVELVSQRVRRGYRESC